jgi:hypothetical protein
MRDPRLMNQRHVLTIQLDKILRDAFEAFCEHSEAKLGRKVTEAEAARFLIRKAIDAKASIADAGYTEGFRAGMAEAKRAFAEGVASATAKTVTGANVASKSAH